MTIRIETLAVRDDYDSLTDIMMPLSNAIRELGGDMKQADELARGAIMAAWTSQDLIDSDRPRVAAKIKEKYQAAKDAVLSTVQPPPADVLVVDAAKELTSGGAQAAKVEAPLAELMNF